MLYRCHDCREIFDEERAIPILDHHDDMYDRGLVAYHYLTCPHCGSDALEDEHEAGFHDDPDEEEIIWPRLCWPI